MARPNLVPVLVVPDESNRLNSAFLFMAYPQGFIWLELPPTVPAFQADSPQSSYKKRALRGAQAFSAMVFLTRARMRPSAPGLVIAIPRPSPTAFMYLYFLQ